MRDVVQRQRRVTRQLVAELARRLGEGLGNKDAGGTIENGLGL